MIDGWFLLDRYELQLLYVNANMAIVDVVQIFLDLVIYQDFAIRTKRNPTIIHRCVAHPYDIFVNEQTLRLRKRIS